MHFDAVFDLMQPQVPEAADPIAEFFEEAHDVGGQQNVPGIATVHYPLRGVLIKKRKQMVDDTLTAAEAKIVRRGESQLKRGDSKPWRVVKHALSR